MKYSFETETTVTINLTKSEAYILECLCSWFVLGKTPSTNNSESFLEFAEEMDKAMEKVRLFT